MLLDFNKLNLPLFLCLFSVAALALAYISQYWFDMEPCILCLYQRVPYFIVIALSLLSLLARGWLRLSLLLLCSLALLSGGAIAFYHVGVEHGVFELAEGCGAGEVPNSLEEAMAGIMGKPNIPCDEPQFIFLGISMAGWNFFLSSALGLITLIMIFRVWKNARQNTR